MRTAGLVAAFVASVAVLMGGVVAQQQPTFRSGVEIILIDVNVVGLLHKPIDDLQPTDFLVTVDGKPRKVVSAQFVRYAVGSSMVAGRQPVEPSLVPLIASGTGRPARNVLIVIDNDSLFTDDGLAARKAAERFVDRMAPGDRVGVMTLPFAGRDITMTTDHDQVRKAVGSIVAGSERFQPTPYTVGLVETFGVERGDRDLMDRILKRECPTGDQLCREEVKLVVRQMQTQEHLRGQRSLDGLLRVALTLTQLPGPKTMVLVSGGAPPPDIRAGYDYKRLEAAFASAQITLYTIYIREAQIRQGKTRPTWGEDTALERESVENATSAAGGTFMESLGSFEEYFERVAMELSGSYVVGIEVETKDRDGRPHRAEVRVNKPGLTVRARRQYVIERTKAGAAPTPPAANATLPPAVRANRTGARGLEPSGDVQPVLSRVIDYVANYRREYSGVVADEDYRQRTPTAEVRLRSDFLLVKTDDDEGWVSFRDVYEVDGVAIRDRDDRLRKLFLDPSTEARAQLQKIKEESARYNIGAVYRNVNVPLFPLLFLDRGNVARFEFTLGKRRDSGGVKVLQIRFAEQQRPTIVSGMRAIGSFLVDESTGAVVESEAVFTNAAGQSADIVIEYAKDPTLGVWVPARMDESYTTREGSVLVRGTATYSKFRRFQVTTDEKIKVPK